MDTEVTEPDETSQRKKNKPLGRFLMPNRKKIVFQQGLDGNLDKN